jgi:SAM-dependent methyltransferase
MGLRALVPWWLRMYGKLVLSRLPVPYSLWSRLNLFRHGRMDSAGYARQCFDIHWAAVGAAAPRTILEIGPGDSIASACIAHTRGVTRSYLVDSGAYATQRIADYAPFLERVGPPAPESFAALCRMIGCEYLTEGVRSLASVPDASVDLVFSHATLEHIPLDELGTLYKETRRVLRPGGVASHQVDLQDHLGGGLNNLRFGRKFWEGSWVRNGGFYTNRVRMPEHLPLNVRRFDRPAIGRGALAPEFRQLDDDALSVSGFLAVLDPVG